MTAPRLVVFDLDHTLLLTGSRITPEAAAGVAALARDGLTVALASARLDESMAVVNRAIGDPVHRISYNGALTTLADGTVVREVGFTVTAELGAVLARFTEQGTTNLYLDDGRWLAIGRPEAIAREEHDTWCVASSHAASATAGELEGLRCRKILCEGPDELVADLDAAVARMPGLNLTHSGMGLHDIWSASSGKGNALRALCEALGISPDEVIAAGDSDTDVPMLDLAGTSIGILPCAARVREVADHLVEGAGSEALFATVRELAGLPR